ncbi:MAG: hypothetical protein LBK70_01110 [Clostridiales bacterium]|jgi:hypothetical protein|nr:hypothetical protein [Clostridiales bacterium]
MKYAYISLKYMHKNWLVYFVISILPSIILGIYSTPFNIATFWIKYKELHTVNFGSMLGLLFNVNNIIYVYPLIAIAVLVVMSSSMYYNTMEQHLKVGRLSLDRPIMGINYTIIPVVISLSIFVVVVVLLKIIIASISYVIHETLHQRLDPIVVNMIMAIVAILLIFVSIALFLSMILWIPSLIMSGYKFMDMMVYCLRLVQSNFLHIYFSVIMPMIVTVIVSILLSLLNIEWIIFFFNIFVYLFWIMYLQTFSMVAYFALTNIEILD